jgi:copper resistance protein B
MNRQSFRGGALLCLSGLFCASALAQTQSLVGPPADKPASKAHAHDTDAPHDHRPGAQASGGPPARPWSQADAIFGAEQMAAARVHALHEMGDMPQGVIMADRLEVQGDDGSRSLVWDLWARYGGDIDRLWLKAEGEADLRDGGVEEAEVQALWSRAVAAYWDVQVGLRYDVEPDGLAHGVIGLHGLAPFLFEVDAVAFLSERGDLTARMETEYALLLTQQLILQPRVELEWAASDIPDRGLAAGLSHLNAGLRLRYELTGEVAPYLGVEWSRSLGGTADAVRLAGGDREVTRWVAGVRLWY